MSRFPDPTILSYASARVQTQLAAMESELEGLENAEDIEAIHRMRVASRRLRAILSTFALFLPAHRSLEWAREVRSVTRALGAARDLDVQIEFLENFTRTLPLPAYRPGLLRLQLRWKQQRAHQQERVLRTLKRWRKSSATAEIQKYILPYVDLQSRPDALPYPGLYELALDTIQVQLKNFLSLENEITDPGQKTQLHQMRIAGKHLRYTLEIFEPLYAPDFINPILKVMRSVQDGLGQIHDCDAWIETLPDFMEREKQLTSEYYGNLRSYHRMLPGFEYFHQSMEQKRSDLHNQFLLNWQNWNEKGVWTSLADGVQAACPSSDTYSTNLSTPIE